MVRRRGGGPMMAGVTGEAAAQGGRGGGPADGLSFASCATVGDISAGTKVSDLVFDVDAFRGLASQSDTSDCPSLSSSVAAIGPGDDMAKLPLVELARAGMVKLPLVAELARAGLDSNDIVLAERSRRNAVLSRGTALGAACGSGEASILQSKFDLRGVVTAPADDDDASGSIVSEAEGNIRSSAISSRSPRRAMSF